MSEQTNATSSLEQAKTLQDRRWWHIEPCPSFTEKPEECWYRTLESEETTIEFVGQKETLPDVAAVFMVPVYHKEWTQGNIQAQLFELLSRDYSDNTNIEIVYLLNELGRDRVETDDEYFEFIKQFPRIPNPNKTGDNDWIPDTIPDFSSMTVVQFRDFQELRYGRHVGYPDSLLMELQDRVEIDNITSINDQILNLFKDIARVQYLGKADITHPAYYPIVQEELTQVFDKYQDDPECLEIIRLSFANAKHVSINLLNLLNTDFIAEGYNRKGIASIRTIGMDYARLRYGDRQDIIAEHLDVDCVPSTAYVQQMFRFYKHTGLDCTQVPRAGFLIPGLTAQLSETGINAALNDSTIHEFPPMVTREQSSTLGLLTELNGVSGEPVGSMHRDEDEYLGRRMERFAAIAGGSSYRRIQELPPVAHCMIDRPGWVDGAHRGNEDTNGHLPGSVVYEILSNTQHQAFLDIEKYRQWLEVYQHNASQEDARIPEPPGFELINTKYIDYLSAFFTEIYQPQNQRNRDLFKQLCSLRKSSSIVYTNSSVIVNDWNCVPEEDRFDVAHFINHHASFVSEMSDEDWQYVEYLLSDNNDLQLQPTSKFQISLKEYIGIAELPENIINENFEFSQSEDQAKPNKRSCAFAAGAFKLAYELCIQNFFRTKIDRDGGRATTSNQAPRCFDSFEKRSLGLQQVLGF